MELMFIGAAHEVTGSCYYLQVAKHKFLVDCGMEQGGNVYVNADIPVKPSEIEFIIVTHAHIDHTGIIPKLYHEGFRGQIISTPATAGLCDIMLRDAAHIQAQEAEYRNRKENRSLDGKKFEPLYTMADTVEAIKLFTPYEYNKIFQACDGVRFRFTDVGHLLGSASVELWLEEGNAKKKIVFSGDIGNKDQPILKDPTYTKEADYVVMESTYGDRLHEEAEVDIAAELADMIRRTLLRGGNVVIPAFAVGRTQTMLYYIRQIKEDNMVPEMPDFPVYLDSPLAVDATEVFSKYGEECFDDETKAMIRQGINPINFPGLNLSITTDDSKAINEDDEPKVIISASGMCDAGRIRHHLKFNLWRPECTIAFVGYQTPGSLGRKLEDGVDEVKLFGEPVAVKAEIAILPGMSGHADRDGLLEWIGAFEEKPKHVFVTHGEDSVTDRFAEELRVELDLNATAPYSGTRFDLATGKFIEVTKGIRISEEVKARVVSDSYTGLQMAVKRADKLVRGASGWPNKDMDSFAKELNALCDKYSR